MLKWTLTENSVGLNCAQAGVANVYVNFRDSQNKFVFEGSGLLSACDAPFAEYRLYPGTYAVFVQAVGSNPMRTYESNLTSPPVVSVTSGVFPASSAALNIIVPRKT